MRITESRLRQVVREVLNEMSDAEPGRDAYFAKEELGSKKGASDDVFKAMMGDEGDELEARVEKLELKVRNLDNRVNNLVGDSF